MAMAFNLKKLISFPLCLLSNCQRIRGTPASWLGRLKGIKTRTDSKKSKDFVFADYIKNYVYGTVKMNQCYRFQIPRIARGIFSGKIQNHLVSWSSLAFLTVHYGSLEVIID